MMTTSAVTDTAEVVVVAAATSVTERDVSLTRVVPQTSAREPTTVMTILAVRMEVEAEAEVEITAATDDIKLLTLLTKELLNTFQSLTSIGDDELKSYTSRQSVD